MSASDSLNVRASAVVRLALSMVLPWLVKLTVRVGVRLQVVEAKEVNLAKCSGVSSSGSVVCKHFFGDRTPAWALDA